MTEWTWTGRREEAAMLVAEDRLSDEQIAERLRMSREGLRKWKRRPEFAQRVADLRAALRQAVVERGITERQNRVEALNERWRLMQQVIEARAEKGGEAAGAKTGLLTKTIKVVGAGKDQYEVEEWAVDTALLRELREHEKQAAQELGQWLEKHQFVDDLDLSDLSDDELEAISRGKAVAALARKGRAGAPPA